MMSLLSIHTHDHKKLIETRGIRRSDVEIGRQAQIHKITSSIKRSHFVNNVTQNNQSISEEDTGVTKASELEHTEASEKKSKVESDEKDDEKETRTKAPEEGEREGKGKGMSAIVVIGNRTHRVSGPVVKQLLFELEHQNGEKEEKPKAIEAVPAREIDGPPAVNLRRLYAANEVAEINKLLGKPLTDAKALGLIKNLLLDKVHTHLQKTMETGTGDSSHAPLVQESNRPSTLHPEADQPQTGAITNDLFAARKHATHDSTCHDMDPKDKCAYLKELGLCTEGEKHPEVRRRCQETCGLCGEACIDCGPSLGPETPIPPPLPAPLPPPLEPEVRPRPNIPLPMSPPAPPSNPLPPLNTPAPLTATPVMTHVEHKIDQIICKEKPCEQPRPCKEPCAKEPLPPPVTPTRPPPCKEIPCTTKPPCREKPTCKQNACNEEKDPSCLIVIEEGRFEKAPCKEAPPCYEIHEIHEAHECKEHPCGYDDDHDIRPCKKPCDEVHETHVTTCKEKPCYDVHESPCKEHPCDEPKKTKCKERPCDEPKEILCKERPCAPTKHLPTLHASHPPAILHPSRMPHTTNPIGCTESLLDAPIRPNLCPVSTVPGHPTPEAMLDPESTIHPLLTNLPLTPTLPMSGSTIGMGTRFLPTHRAHHGHPTLVHPNTVDVIDTPGSTAAVISANGVCQLPMEIGIAMDTSAAMVPHWQQMLYFVKSLVDKFQMNGIARIGIITFDTIAKIPIRLEKYRDGEMLKQHLDKLFADPYGRRRTDAALVSAQNSFFERGRPGVPKVLFIVEHGRINGGDPSINWEDLLIEPSDKLREMGVNIFAVGATPIVTPEELKVLTGDWSHVVPLQSYSQLQGIVPQLAIKACKLAGIVRRSKNPKISVH